MLHTIISYLFFQETTARLRSCFRTDTSIRWYVIRKSAREVTTSQTILWSTI